MQLDFRDVDSGVGEHGGRQGPWLLG
jgi:hypothetical protein